MHINFVTHKQKGDSEQRRCCWFPGFLFFSVCCETLPCFLPQLPSLVRRSPQGLPPQKEQREMCLRKLWASVLRLASDLVVQTLDGFCYLTSSAHTGVPDPLWLHPLAGLDSWLWLEKRASAGQSTCLSLPVSAVFSRLCPLNVQTQTEHCLVLGTMPDTGSGNEQKDTCPHEVQSLKQ